MPLPPEQRCKATNRRGEQCGRRPIPGGAVCKIHGGAAPQVRRKAALRLLEAADYAVGVLIQEMESTDNLSGDRIRAADSILDRAGVSRKVEHVSEDDARELLVSKLQSMQKGDTTN